MRHNLSELEFSKFENFQNSVNSFNPVNSDSDFLHNTIKDPHWYAVQGSDTTMMPRAASLPGQKLFAVKNITAPMLSFP